MHRNPLLGIIVGCLVLLSATAARAQMQVETTGIGHGVKVWYVENAAVPVIDIRLSFEGAGSASDPEGKGGRAAFAAAMLTEGAGLLDSVAFRRALEDKAIQLSVDTDEDRLIIHLYALREHAVFAGEMLALALSKPLLADSDQARMKADLSSLLARLDERPGYRAERQLAQRAFKGHPYSNPHYGTLESIGRLGAEDVKSYLNTYVTRGNVLVSAAGDVDAALLDDVLSPVIDALAANDAGAVAVTPTDVAGAGEELRMAMDVPQTTILFAAPAIARSDARFYAQFLLNYIVGESALFSRLGAQVRQKKGLVYSIGTDLDMRRGASLLSGALATRNANADAAIQEVKTVLAELQKKGVTTEECADAKSYALGAFSRQLDGASAMSRMLLSMQIHKLGEDYLNDRADYFKRVSCGEINEVATEILNPANFLFSVVGGAPEAGGVVPLTTATPARHDAQP
jgi:zinc protease